MKHLISAIFFPLLLCWVSVASGKTAIVWHSQGFFSFFEYPVAQYITDYHVLPAENGGQEFKRRYSPYRLTALLRFQQSASQAIARVTPNPPQPDTSSLPFLGTDFPSTKSVYLRSPPLALVLKRIDTFPPQQNRLGGWKESNIQYRGRLTYHLRAA